MTVSALLVAHKASVAGSKLPKKVTAWRVFESLPQVGHKVELMEGRKRHTVAEVVHTFDGEIEIDIAERLSPGEIQLLIQEGWKQDT